MVIFVLIVLILRRFHFGILLVDNEKQNVSFIGIHYLFVMIL